MNRLIASLIFSLAVPLLSSGAVVYSGIQDLTVPSALDGLYLDIATGTSTGTYPSDWNDKAYFNPFYGGVAIATSDLFRPVIMGSDQVVNVIYQSLIDSSLTFALGENGSGTHIGAGPGQFALGVEGFVAYQFQTTVGGPIMFGWARVIFNNAGSGVVRDWAYNDTPGQGLYAGTLTVVPEPSRVLLLLPGWVLMLGLRRRR